MNLNNNPTKEQLAELLRGYDDRAAHHVLWVDRTGEVRITKLAKTWPPPEPGADVLDQAVVRFETLVAGKGYVGPEAAADDQWLKDAIDWLSRDWATAKTNGKPALIRI
jgi:hypothetical protein